MIKPEISIITPGIRQNLWTNYYESIKKSTTRPFELVIISPYSLSSELQTYSNIKYIKDFGSPVRCFNLGVSLAEGKYLTIGADDGLYQPNTLDMLINRLEEMPPNEKNIVSAKYTEAGNSFPDSYFLINNSTWTSSPYIPNDWYIFNVFLMYTSYFKKIGEFDILFEGPAMALTDFAIRCYRDNAQIIFYPIEVLYVAWEGAEGGTHAPIYHAHMENDAPLYKQIHNDPASLKRKQLVNNNWKLASTVWSRRFGIL